MEAQWAPAFGVCIGEMDGDGNEDVFLSQNLFALNVEMSRNDAGRGLWLKGDGKGGLTTVPGQTSGVKVYGEQRGCALGDYDADGRADLVVTQNGNAPKLFRNAGAKMGLRMRFKGAPENPNAIGAAVRLEYGATKGPIREIQAGSGYWSQNATVQIMGTREAPTGLWVRWPGGKETSVKVPATAREVEVNAEGQLKVIK
jgi:hypothetical protein